jgi:hypothetical protein
MPAHFTVALVGFLAALGSQAGAVSLETIKIGERNSPNGSAIPFGGDAGAAGEADRFQQAWQGSVFGPDPILINAISFTIRRSSPTFNYAYRFGTYEVSFSTTSLGVNGLSGSNLDANRGADNAVFDTRVLGSDSNAPTGDASVRFESGAGFLYDPLDGNLLMDLKIAHSGDSNDVSEAPVAVDWNVLASGGLFGSVNNFGSAYVNTGLIATFDLQVLPRGLQLAQPAPPPPMPNLPAPVPLPAAAWMLIAGLGALLAAARGKPRSRTAA